MAGSVNKVILVGNLGQDPEISTLNNGSSVAKLSIATSESWKDANTKERRERTEWHRVIIYNKGLVKIVQEYARKGTQLYVEGQLQTRKFTTTEDVEKSITEIVLQPFSGDLTLLSGGKQQPEEGTGQYIPE